MNYKCLVVEYEKNMKEILETILNNNNVHYISFNNDGDAIKYLNMDSNKVDLVLCQAPLPGSKNSLLLKIRNLEKYSKMPIICLAYSNSLQGRSLAASQGASEYIVRPFNPVNLIERLNYWSKHPHVDF